MAWSAPITAVAHASFPAASFNSSVRDNLLETEPGKAISSVANGSIPVKSGTNQTTMRTPGQVEIMTSQTTTSTSYTNLSTAGPTVSATTGTSAFVFWHGSLAATSSNYTYMSMQITNSTTVTHTADDNRALRHRDGTGTNGEELFGIGFLFTDLTAGLNSFQTKYRVSGGTGTFRRRRIGVIPL